MPGQTCAECWYVKSCGERGGKRKGKAGMGMRRNTYGAFDVAVAGLAIGWVAIGLITATLVDAEDRVVGALGFGQVFCLEVLDYGEGGSDAGEQQEERGSLDGGTNLWRSLGSQLDACDREKLQRQRD